MRSRQDPPRPIPRHPGTQIRVPARGGRWRAGAGPDPGQRSCPLAWRPPLGSGPPRAAYSPPAPEKWPGVGPPQSWYASPSCGCWSVALSGASRGMTHTTGSRPTARGQSTCRGSAGIVALCRLSSGGHLSARSAAPGARLGAALRCHHAPLPSPFPWLPLARRSCRQRLEVWIPPIPWGARRPCRPPARGHRQPYARGIHCSACFHPGLQVLHLRHRRPGQADYPHSSRPDRRRGPVAGTRRLPEMAR